MKNQKQQQTQNPKIELKNLRSCSSNKSKLTKPRRSPDPREKISTYFQSTQSKKSPKSTKKTITDDESDDFATPKPLRAGRAFTVKSQNEKKKVTKPKKVKPTLSNNSIVKPIYNDTNQEHLELAFAMSKSLDELENPNSNVDDSNSSSGSIKGTLLEQFGFKSDRAVTNLPKFITNQNTRKKFRFLTPILFLRKEEDRIKQIESRVNDILTNIATYNEHNSNTQSPDENIEPENNKPKSFLLREYYNPESVMFKRNGLSLNEMEDDLFYNNTVESSGIKVGTLLKDWSSIPGREKTPSPRKKSEYNSEEIIPCSQNEKEAEIPSKSSEELIPCSQIEEETQGPLKTSEEQIPCFQIENHNSNDKEIENRSITPELFSDDDIIENSYPEKQNSINDNLIDDNSPVHSDSGSCSLLDIVSPHKKKKILLLRQEKSCKKNIFNVENSTEKQNPINNNLIDDNLSVHSDSGSCSLLDIVSPNKKKKILLLRQEKSCKKNILNVENTTENYDDDFKLIQSSNDSTENVRIQRMKSEKFLDFYEAETVKRIVFENSFNLDSDAETIKRIESDNLDSDVDTIKRKETKNVIDDLDSEAETIKRIQSEEIIDLTETIIEPEPNPVEVDGEEYSPEFDCFNSLNNEQFYNSLNKTFVVSSDNETKVERLKENSEIQENVNVNDHILYLSQPSFDLCSDVSDEELNYSSTTPFKKKLKISEPLPSTSKTLIHNHQSTPIQDKCIRSECSVLLDNSLNEILKRNETPKNKNFIIKTHDVTPNPNFNDMGTPIIHQELDKFGLKPMKRTRGIKMLQYIYDATHPVSVGHEGSSNSDDDTRRSIKRRKINEAQTTISSNTIQSQMIEKINVNPDIVESEPLNEMIFERKQSSRIASCRLPLHIAWYNFVSTQQELQEKILLYEPLQVEQIYRKFKEFGYKYHIQDLIKFLDKKCITIKLEQNNRNRKGCKSSKLT